MVDGDGTAENPWRLTTASGTSAYTMYREGDGLICEVGSTALRYHARAIEALGLVELEHNALNNRV